MLRPIAGLATLLLLASGCRSMANNMTVNRVVPRAMATPDVDQACEIGSTLNSPLAAMAPANRPPHRALVVAETTAALCDEAAAWEYELAAARARSDHSGIDSAARAAVVTDATLRADRAHARAAARFSRAYGHTEAEYGPVGEGCPHLKAREELVYVLGLFAGMQSVLHDSVSGSTVGVPKSRLAEVARGSACLDNEKWWHLPQAMRAAAWATIPGSGPPDSDPWALLAEAAGASDASGVRLGRALQVLITANAGREGDAIAAITAHASALETHPRADDFALLDTYATWVSRHQSDLVWTAATGHRTKVLGQFPSEPGSVEVPSDLFGADPFGEDPPSAPGSETPADSNDTPPENE